MNTGMNMKRSGIVAAMILCALVASSCGTTKVRRVDADKIIDMDGNWNDNDVRIVCATLIADCASSPAVAQYRRQNGRYNHDRYSGNSVYPTCRPRKGWV